MAEPRWIEESYVDDRGIEHTVSESTRRVLAERMGPSMSQAAAPLVVASTWIPQADGVACLEDGSGRPIREGRPVDLPWGYHRFVSGTGDERSLIVAPRRCRQPDRRTWGIAVQLHSARSRSSWGIGDLRDLATLRTATARAGAGFVLVNPLHAAAPVAEQENCPYAPVSRIFRNPLYLSIVDVPGAATVDLSGLGAAAARANLTSRLDRDAVWRIKRSALERIRAARYGEAEFTTWRAAQPPELNRFATWCALSEVHGPSTALWPIEFQRWDGPGVATFAAQARDRVEFHTWLQWVVAVQLQRFGAGVVHDLATGVRSDGADPWIWPDMFASGLTVGAPPDALNTAGQDWGLVPLHPGRLRAADYRPFVRVLRATPPGSAGLRIDHVLGLFRLWVVPHGCDPAEGAYVRYPTDDLLAILALESHRLGVPVIGEDLGTVGDGVRERLDASGVLSSRVMLLSDDPPTRWPVGSFGSASTHDLPTISGLWTGTDLADQEAAGVAAADETRRLRARLTARIGMSSGEPATAVTAVHRQLGAAPSVLVAVSLEDLLGEEHRPNIPATDRVDNWTRPLPVPVDDLGPLLVTAAAVLGRPGGPFDPTVDC